MAWYFMECYFDYQKTQKIEDCNLMGCERKHNFQEYFIKKMMIGKNWRGFIVLIGSS